VVLLIFLSNENFQQQKNLHFSLNNFSCHAEIIQGYGSFTPPPLSANGEGNGKGEDGDEQS